MMLTEISINRFTRREAPANLKPSDWSKFLLEEHIPTGVSAPRELQNITLLSNGIFFKDGRISALSYPFPQEEFIRHYAGFQFLLKQWIRFLLSRNDRIGEEAIVLTDLFSGNYYHWFTETLPRLYKAKDHLKKNSLVVLPANCNKDFIRESIALSGFRSCFIGHPFRKLDLPRAFFLPHTIASGRVDADITNGLRRFLVGAVAGNTAKRGADRLYISRQQAGVRRLLNENEAIVVLQKYGFTAIRMEDFSWPEQVRIMKNARHVVSPHGAGLTNMMFIPDKACILELLPVRLNNTVNFCYFNLASALGHTYFYQLRNFQDRSGVKDGGDANYAVDLQELEHNLKLMLACQ
ncbi:MAG: glycosyltransferase 61 family protein [Mangrovibacterium sp.]|nr:glycosyltransferase 61 family protein [Mangrovibacterium sp.]